MTAFSADQTVGSIVAARPALSRVFENAGIDYCCGGKKPLSQACRENGLDTKAILAALEQHEVAGSESYVDAASMSLTELADHIEQSHHGFLRRELPRLNQIALKVATVHGDKDARLKKVSDTLSKFAAELTSHMMKEEMILFPFIRKLDSSDAPVEFFCGTVANPIRQMEDEHQDAGDALAELRTLTDGFTPPEWACNTYRALLDGLAQLEGDMHQHVHKEDNVLFPRSLEREAALATRNSEIAASRG